MADSGKTEQAGSGRLRTIVAGVLAVVGAVGIWLVEPWTGNWMRTSFGSNSYLPATALSVVLLLVLVVNPLFHRLLPRLALSRRQLALILTLLLMAATISGQGLMLSLPYTLTWTARSISHDRNQAAAFEDTRIPQSFFPGGWSYDNPNLTSDYFATELPPGAAIPWGDWLAPLGAWGAFMIASWLMMLGLSAVVFPQWRRNERLPFPLLDVYDSIIEDPKEGRCFAPLFRRRSFWVAAGAVFILHFLSGMHLQSPSGVPAVPLDWDLSVIFSEPPLSYLPSVFQKGHLYFTLVGVAFFMPARMGFSVWFFAVAYGIYVALITAYMPPYHSGAPIDMRVGAMFSFLVAVLWLGRAEWARVAGAVLRPRSGTERERRGGLMFAVGVAGMFAWMVFYVGVQPFWALYYVGFAFLTSVLIARLVAETGMPYVRIDSQHDLALPALVPTSWISSASFYFSYVMFTVFLYGSRLSPAVMATHGMGLNEKEPPRYQSRILTGLLIVLVVGMLVAGASHLVLGYRHATSFDGIDQPLGTWSNMLMSRGLPALQKLQAGTLNQAGYNRWAHLGFGATLAGVLQWLCLNSPRWPLHPLGLIMMGTFYSNSGWWSILLGWLLKVLLVRFGGARLYRQARPVFLGLILGEVFATLFWSVLPVIFALQGRMMARVLVAP